MLNVIKSEIYKTRHRVYLFVFLGICCLLGLGAVYLFALSGGGQSRIYYEDILRLPLAALSFGVYFALIPCDIVFSEEYKHQTMKNTLTFGISRRSLYFGKLITSILVALFSAALIIGVFVGSAYLFLGVKDAAAAGEITQRMLLSLACSLPLWIGALSVLNMMSFQFRNSTIMSLSYVGLFAILSLLMTLMGYYVSPVFDIIHDWMIMPQFDVIKSAASISGPLILKCTAIGFGYTVGSTVIGLLLFRKRDIK